MIISFATQKIEDAVNGVGDDDMTGLEQIIRRKKAPCTPDEILETLDALHATPSLFDLPKIPFHPEPLKGSRKGTFSVRINKKARIIFRPDHDDDSEFRIDNPKTIKCIVIDELCVDYHGH